VRDHARRYLRVDGNLIGWDLIRTAYTAVSRIAVIPMQDILSLGPEARFNLPGKPDGNWRWRMSDKDLTSLESGGRSEYLRELAELNGRVPQAEPGDKPGGPGT
jgi:4-alpha-glucanotransferase